MDIRMIERGGHLLCVDQDGVFMVALAGWPSQWIGRDRDAVARQWRDLAYRHEAEGLAAAAADVAQLTHH